MEVAPKPLHTPGRLNLTAKPGQHTPSAAHSAAVENAQYTGYCWSLTSSQLYSRPEVTPAKSLQNRGKGDEWLIAQVSRVCIANPHAPSVHLQRPVLVVTK